MNPLETRIARLELLTILSICKRAEGLGPNQTRYNNMMKEIILEISQDLQEGLVSAELESLIHRYFMLYS